MARRVAKSITWLMAILLIGATPVFSADDGTWWKLSLAIMAAANTADTVTSLRANGQPGLHETSPLYGQRFTGRDVAVKVGLVGGQVIVQRFLVKRHPRLARWFTVLNLGQSAGPAWAAQHNEQLKR
jgi:hypothetical protein